MPTPTLPTVGADYDTWGIELNEYVAAVKATADAALAASIAASDEAIAAVIANVASATRAAIIALAGGGAVAWDDIQGAPDFALLAHTHLPADIPALATVATTGDFNDLTNKPVIPGASIVTAAPGQVFFRRQVAGVWDARGSTRTDVLVFWDVNGGDPAILPTEAVGSDTLLGA
jgi:hypothetical protein